MKHKYIFTKYGYRKNNVKLMEIISETDEDYDVADIFMIDYFSDEGETISIEAENLNEAIYAANRWFGSCVTSNNIRVSEMLDRNKFEEEEDPYTIWENQLWIFGELFDEDPPYIPAPVKRNVRTTKRYRKYYSDKWMKPPYGPHSAVFEYGNFLRNRTKI